MNDLNLIYPPSSALAAVGRHLTLRSLSWILTIGLVAVILALIFTPWQQSVVGSGRVIAYAPLDRQQEIEAPIDGRVDEWFVQEGDFVEQGQPLAELADNDPEILRRLETEITAAKSQRDSMTLSMTMTEGRIASLIAARDFAIENAKHSIQMAQERVAAAERAQDAARAAQITAEKNFERQSRLVTKGLVSERDMELAELAVETSRADAQRAQASLRAAQSEIKALESKRSEIASSHQASIESTRSTLEKLRAEQSKAEAELAKVEVRFARQQHMTVRAPRAGTILRLLVKQDTEMVKAGESLVVLVPEAQSRAVELYLDGNDAPLVDKGRPVRIQFEGWPAVQFVGWPSVAVGTFGGEVAFVDAHDDGHGRFRVVVVPGKADEWPSDRYLRQGVQARGWVLLDQVRLGFEAWRQLNGFPPAIYQEQKQKPSSNTKG